MDARHRIVEEKGRVLVSCDEIDREVVQQIRHVFILLHLLILAVEVVGTATVSLRGPVVPAALEDEILIKAPLARPEAYLAPFAHAGRGVSGFFHHRGEHHLAIRAHGVLAVVGVQSRAERIAPGERLASRWPAQRGGVAILEARPPLRELVNVRCVKRAAATMDVSDAHIVAHDEDDVRLSRRLLHGGRCRSAHGPRDRCNNN